MCSVSMTEHRTYETEHRTFHYLVKKNKFSDISDPLPATGHKKNLGPFRKAWIGLPNSYPSCFEKIFRQKLGKVRKYTTKMGKNLKKNGQFSAFKGSEKFAEHQARTSNIPNMCSAPQNRTPNTSNTPKNTEHRTSNTVRSNTTPNS